MKLGLRKEFGLVLGKARESHGRRLWSTLDVVWEKFPFIGYFNEHDLKRKEWSKAWAGIGQGATGRPISQHRRVFCHFCGLQQVLIFILFETLLWSCLTFFLLLHDFSVALFDVGVLWNYLRSTGLTDSGGSKAGSKPKAYQFMNG